MRAAHVSASGSSAGGRLTITGESVPPLVEERTLAVGAGGWADWSGDKRSTDVRGAALGPIAGGCEDDTE
jgi:hypothetical protein